MTIAKLISLGIQVSMMLIVFCMALEAHARFLPRILAQRGLLLRSLLALNVIFPLVVAGLCGLFALHPSLEVALIVLALSPVPPIAPNKEFKAGGRESLVLGTLVFSALLAIVTVPLGVQVISRLFNRPTSVTPDLIAFVVFTSILLPLAAGFAFKWLAPKVAERISGPVSTAATVVLVLCCIPILFTTWQAMVALVGNFTLVAILVFVLIGLAIGHWLGGPRPEDRTVLAIATASRHPGVALAVAHVVSPEDKSVTAAVLLAFLVGAIAAIPYVKWRAMQHAQAGVQ